MDDAVATESAVIYDLWELRGDALRALSSIIAPAAYLWECWLLFEYQRFAWELCGPFVLGLGASAGYLLAKRQPRLAAYVFVVSLAATSFVVSWFSGLSLAPYLALPTVLCAGVLVDPPMMLLVAAMLGLGLAGATWAHVGYPAGLPELARTLGLLAVTAGASWLSARNLHTALQWAMESYGKARDETERARQQRGQLRQALKSMDEASGRLQWMNYELARARDAAEELRRLKQQFVANVSHELRTPLALIAGFSEMMYLSQGSYSALLPLDYVGDVREIYRNSQHLLSLIDDVLDLSRITSGKMLLARREADPGETIREAVDTIRPLIEGKGLTLELELEDPLPAIYMDPNRVRQVLLNLLNNARRFTERGGIKVQAGCEGEELLVSVTDTGVGISAAEQPKLFEEFRQLDGSLARQYDGVGLGLAIGKEFVEMHGGRIWVESEGLPGKGSAFRFTLPLYQADGADRARRELVRGRPVPSSEPMRALLLASQDASVLHLLERQLDGYRIVHAEATSQIPGLAARLCPQAVLLSASPGREAEQLREAQAWIGMAEVPVILCPLGGEEYLARALGVRAYLMKPIQREVFLETLASLGKQVRRVLIVDDDPRFVRLLSRIIRSASRPYDVLRAYSARDGLARLRDRAVDAIVLDLLMPEMDGRMFLDTLRQGDCSRVPVIVVTSKAYDIDDAQQWGSRLFALAYGRGFSNEEAVSHLKGILDVLKRRPPQKAN